MLVLTHQLMRLVNSADFLALLEDTLSSIVMLPQTVPGTASLPPKFEADWNCFMLGAKKAHGIAANKDTLLLYYRWAEDMQRKFGQELPHINRWYAREWQPLCDLACGEAAKHRRERYLPAENYLTVDDFVTHISYRRLSTSKSLCLLRASSPPAKTCPTHSRMPTSAH